MKLFQYSISFVILLLLVFFPTAVFAQKRAVVTPSPSPSPTIAPVNSYELFWPISAGKVMGEKLYSLKLFKEWARELLIFSDLKKVDYNIALSEKRVVEAEKLFTVKKDYDNGKKTLEAAQQKREKALTLVGQAQGKGRYVADLVNRFTRSLENQRALLSYVATSVSSEAKDTISKNIDSLNSIIAKLQ